MNGGRSRPPPPALRRSEFRVRQRPKRRLPCHEFGQNIRVRAPVLRVQNSTRSLRGIVQANLRSSSSTAEVAIAALLHIRRLIGANPAAVVVKDAAFPEGLHGRLAAPDRRSMMRVFDSILPLGVRRRKRSHTFMLSRSTGLTELRRVRLDKYFAGGGNGQEQRPGRS